MAQTVRLKPEGLPKLAEHLPREPEIAKHSSLAPTVADLASDGKISVIEVYGRRVFQRCPGDAKIAERGALPRRSHRPAITSCSS